MSDNEFWQAVLKRDPRYDGQFVYAVRSTGIYCRPTCASRRPNPAQVQYFASPGQAEQAGFRPCRRCQPNRAVQDEPALALIRQVCLYLEEAHDHLPTLDELAQRFNLSAAHLQRTFKRIVGVSPRQYAAAHRMERFRAGLRSGQPVTDAIYDAGYSSPSSVYDPTAGPLGMTPAAYRRGGSGMRVTYSVVPCPLGWLLVAATERGICAVRLGDRQADLEDTLAAEFGQADLRRDDAGLGEWVAAVLAYLGGTPSLDLPLDVQATAFQQRVWEALRAIPYGSTRSYQDIAEAIGQPSAVRAVAHACATNPAALVIPCHRVVRKDGSLGGYRWGLARKRALLNQESAIAQAQEDPHAAR